jgi:phosphonate transport system ATP-binding protein
MATEIALNGVSRYWADQAVVKQVSFGLAAGERVALIGPSGGGKSTLLRLLAGALRPTAGVIEVAGRDMAAFSWRELQRHRSRCRIVDQQHLLVPQSTVHANVLSGLLSTWPWHKALLASLMPVEVARVAALLAQLGIAEHQWRLAGELSGGQMQRVAIARALISDPAIMLADEPTASLDPHTARAVTSQIIEAAKARHMTLVFCSHAFDVVRQDCTRVIGLRDGEVVLDRLPEQVGDEQLEQLYAGSNERL